MKLYGLIGHPLKHSFSAQMFNSHNSKAYHINNFCNNYNNSSCI